MKVRATITFVLEYDLDPSSFDTEGEPPTTPEQALEMEEEALVSEGYTSVVVREGECEVTVEKLED